MNLNQLVQKLVPAVLIIALGFLVYIFLSSASVVAEENHRSQIITVDGQDNKNTVAISGYVIPYKQVTFTAQLSGRVKYLAGQEGQMFQPGQILLAIDESELIAQRKSIQAQLMNAHAGFKNSQVQYNHNLYSPTSQTKNVMPGMGMPAMFDQFFMNSSGSPYFDRRVELYDSMTSVNQARSSWLQTQSQLQAVDAKLRNTQSIAPFNGVIMKKHVEIGDTVQVGQPLISFAHTQLLRIEANIPARLMSEIKLGKIFQVKLDNQIQTQTRVVHIYPNADAKYHTVKVKLDLPVGTPAAMGMYAELQIPISNTDKINNVSIPESALLSGGSLPRVLVMNNNTSSLRVLRVGGINNSGYVTVLAGLKTGEQIINFPPANAKSGWIPD